jgi:hypothetical protein
MGRTIGRQFELLRNRVRRGVAALRADPAAVWVLFLILFPFVWLRGWYTHELASVVERGRLMAEIDRQQQQVSTLERELAQIRAGRATSDEGRTRDFRAQGRVLQKQCD